VTDGGAGLGRFGIADDAGFVDFLAGEADVGGCSSVSHRNGGVAVALAPNNLTSRLRRVVVSGVPCVS
jgi:hypothetical protein